MKINTFQRIIINHNRGNDTHIGHYSYNIQYDFMGGFWRIIRCPRGFEKGHAVQYNSYGNAIESTVNNSWEWRERIPKEVFDEIK